MPAFENVRWATATAQHNTWPWALKICFVTPCVAGRISRASASATSFPGSSLFLPRFSEKQIMTRVAKRRGWRGVEFEFPRIPLQWHDNTMVVGTHKLLALEYHQLRGLKTNYVPRSISTSLIVWFWTKLQQSGLKCGQRFTCVERGARGFQTTSSKKTSWRKIL